MGSFILFLSNEVLFASLSPTSSEIEAALQSIPLVSIRAERQAAGALDIGGFVGHARITRRTGTFHRVTNVAWLYSWTPRATAAEEAAAAREIETYIRGQANSKFNINAWAPAQILPYNPATDGSLAWWASGDASHTNTRDAFDVNEQTGSNASVDNPVGPTTNHAPNMNPFGALGPLFDLVPWIVGGLLVYYVAGPIIGAATARKNPSHRRYVAYHDGQIVGEGNTPAAARDEAHGTSDVPHGARLTVKPYNPNKYHVANDGHRSWLQADS